MINVEIVTNVEIMKFLKENPLDRYEILLTLLDDNTTSSQTKIQETFIKKSPCAAVAIQGDYRREAPARQCICGNFSP